MALVINGQTIPVNDQGYLINPNDWNEEVAQILAQKCNIKLTEAHMQVIYTAREFFAEFDKSPTLRFLVKSLQKKFNKEVGNSRNLQKMFHEPPGKTIALIAGLPKPSDCI